MIENAAETVEQTQVTSRWKMENNFFWSRINYTLIKKTVHHTQVWFTGCTTWTNAVTSWDLNWFQIRFLVFDAAGTWLETSSCNGPVDGQCDSKWSSRSRRRTESIQEISIPIRNEYWLLCHSETLKTSCPGRKWSVCCVCKTFSFRFYSFIKFSSTQDRLMVRYAGESHKHNCFFLFFL